MTSAYPIMSRRYLEPTPARGLFGLGKRVRDNGDLPKPDAHEVMVYRVDGQYILDNAGLENGHDHVVRATHVSVVDVSRNVPVTIQMKVPSAEASDFTVEVTFACTVTDPVRAVRENLNASAALEHYLRSHRKIFQLGLEYKMLQINKMRVDVSAQIMAYTAVRPPTVSGLAVTMTGVRVLTPEELEKFEQRRREKQYEHLIGSQELGYSHDRESSQQRHEQDMDHQRRQHQHVAELEDQEHAQLIDLRTQRGKQLLEAERNEFARRELDKALEAIGGDSYTALLYAHANGQIDAKELAAEMRADRDRRLEIEQQDRERQREAAQLELEWNRADQLRTASEAREDRLRDASEAREDRLRDTNEAREDRLRDAREAREDRLRQETMVREDERRRLELNLDLLRELAKRGQLDMVNVNVERIIAEVSGTGDAALGSHQSGPALTDGSDTSRGPDASRHSSTYTDSTPTDKTNEDTAPSTVDGEFDGPETTVREEDDD